MKEKGHWDRIAGTLYITEGTFTVASTILEGFSVVLLAGSKNETRTVTVGDPTSRWTAIQVQVVQYGTKPSTAKLLEQAPKLLKKLSKKGARIASLLAAAVSVNRARSVFVTYACVKSTTRQTQEMKEGEWINSGDPFVEQEVTKVRQVELSDAEAIPWWDRTRASRTERFRGINRNRPKTGCP